MEPLDDTYIYLKIPMSYQDKVPIFSERNEYVRNYERLARDHMEAQRRTGQNPWIEECLWLEMETSTADLIRKYAAPSQRILDVGVGLGRLLEGFSNLDRYGVDISFDYLRVAQEKGIRVCYALIEDMPYVEKFFDIVVCTDVLEHVLDLNLACCKILSVLKDDGTLIVRVPYREELKPYLDESLAYEYAHFRNFDEHSLRLLFEKIFGCRVVETVFTGYSAAGLRLRYKLPGPLRGSVKSMPRVASTVIRPIKKALKGINSCLPQGIRKILCYPTEIIVVVKKREKTRNRNEFTQSEIFTVTSNHGETMK